MEQEASAVEPRDSGKAIAPQSEVSGKNTAMHSVVSGLDRNDVVVRSSVTVFRHLSSAAQHETFDVQKDYRSGAVYKGWMADNKRCGRGLFVWLDGTRYEGEFVNNSRNGNGIQLWPDGSRYEGTFLNDTKHGTGFHLWANGETFSGKFFKDRCHGLGLYTWPDKGLYQGTFYMGRKEGYGLFTFPDGVKFEGLYNCDERFGPGVLSYPDGREDVGLWFRERLIKLCFPVENAFTIKNCKEYEAFADNNKKCVLVEGIHTHHDLIRAIVGATPEMFEYDSKLSVSHLAKELLLDTLPVGCSAADLAAYDEAFFELPSSANDHCEKTDERNYVSDVEMQDLSNSPTTKTPEIVIDSVHSEDAAGAVTETPSGGNIANDETLNDTEVQVEANQNGHEVDKKIDENQVFAWNSTPSCMLLQAHILRHHQQQQNVGFDIEAILSWSRGRHGQRGPTEIKSEEFLILAANNEVKRIEGILHRGEVNVDVADMNGHTALIGATVNMHLAVINCLLDNGADVNKLNDEGLSALAVCLLSLYPTSSFKSIYDEIKELPVSTPELKGSKVTVTLGKSGKRKALLEAKVEKNDSKRIQELKEELERARSQISEKDSETSSVVSMRANGKVISEERKLGTLSIRRVEKKDPEMLMALNPIPDPLFNENNELVDGLSDRSPSAISEFDSHRIVHNLPINVTDGQIVKCAEMLSRNEMVFSRTRSADVMSEGTVRCLAVEKSRSHQLRETMRLLLRRGANPNASTVPMPALFFAVRSGDVEAVRLLLLKGAIPGARLSPKDGGLSPLHYGCLLPGEDGVTIVELLLNALADPDARAEADDSYLNHYLEEEWSKDVISPGSAKQLGGRTPLHIACSRIDNYELASQIVRLLVEHHADTSLLCNGHSALSLAITSGNDQTVDVLLKAGVNASQPLTHGVGSALCAATLIANESKRKPEDRIALINKLVAAGANMFTPVAVGPKRQIATVVDYAYYMYSLDRKIANVPYHALAPADRETFNARHRLLGHLGHLLRQKAVERETERFQEEDEQGIQKRNPSANFVYTGCGGRHATTSTRQERVKSGKRSESASSEDDIRRPSFRFCYECGRSVGVRLEPCSRCKAVFYCSKACQNKAWSEVHKDECLRIPGQDRTKTASPTRKDKQRASPNQDLKLPEIAGERKGRSRKDQEKENLAKGGKGRPRSAEEAKRQRRGRGADVEGKREQRKYLRGGSAKDQSKNKFKNLDLDSESADRYLQRKGQRDFLRKGQTDLQRKGQTSSAKSWEKDKGKFPPISSKFAEVCIAGPNSKFSNREPDSFAAEQTTKSRQRSTFGQFSNTNSVNWYETDFVEDGNNTASQIVRTLAYLKATNFGIPVKHQSGRRKRLGFGGGVTAWKDGLPDNCHIGNYSYI